MTLTVPTEPVGGRDIVQSELARRSHRSNTIAALRGTPSTTAPLPFYTLTRHDFTLADPLSAAKQVGWRYLIVDGEAPGVVMVSTRKGHFEFAGIASGPLPQRLYEAVTLANRALGTDPITYEVRLLDLPSMRAFAVWLNGASSQFISLMEGQPPGSAALRIETGADFIGRLKTRKVSPSNPTATNAHPTN
ncbi:hypothetical protein M3A49_21720 [Paraburkholderia sp. CNPSo 3076]|uniref:hypothetical protein n=1 Tax=Paraburkholderia sp. CNPSo 3076 TaxID=2940936 RepID=UPI0022564746|nr:hypothetical protein [Paraburkholderia sp. CNPSo 3076]MCX5542096.1 hypothetical protein [Paraburkholderia sp. CNPSo 3076]